MAKGLAIGASKCVRARATDANDFIRSIPVWTKCAFTRDSVADSGLGMLLARAQQGQPPLCQRQVRMEFLLLKSDMKCDMTKELGVQILANSL
ncbi:hypothetical protein ACFXTO_000703 [Malus domestica]